MDLVRPSVIASFAPRGRVEGSSYGHAAAGHRSSDAMIRPKEATVSVARSCKGMFLSLVFLCVAACGGGNSNTDGGQTADATPAMGGGCLETFSGAITAPSGPCNSRLEGANIDGEGLIIGNLDPAKSILQTLTLQLSRGGSFASGKAYQYADFGGAGTAVYIAGGGNKTYTIPPIGSSGGCAGSSLTLTFTSLDAPPAANVDMPTAATHGTLDAMLPESVLMGGMSTCTGAVLTVHVTF